MKRMSLLLMLVCLAVPAVVSAQQARKAEDQYVVLTYSHVPADKTDEYTETLRTTTKKYYEEMMNQPGSNLWAWSAARTVYSGVEAGEANFVLARLYDGPPTNLGNAAAAAVMKKVTGQEPAERRKNLNSLRTNVGTELIRGVAWAPGVSEEGFYRVITYRKLAPNKAAAYREQSSEVWKPVFEALVKEGTVSGWGTWQYVFPRGTDTPYDLVATVTYRDLPSAVKGIQGMQEIFAKVHPGKSLVGTVDESRDASRTVKTVLTRIVAMVQKDGGMSPHATSGAR